MRTAPDSPLLRNLLIVLGLQKSVDAFLSLLHPPAAYAVLRMLGFGDPMVHDPLDRLLPQLWGCASLAWAYFLLRASQEPWRNRIIIEGSVLGFVALGLAALCTPMPLVRVIGILFFVEATLLLFGRLRMDRPASLW